MVSISKRVSGAWQNTSYGIRATATDIITTLPTTIYGDGTNATVSIKGNTTQTGTPTPDSPVMPQGTGERTGNLFDYNAYFDSAFTPYNAFFNYAELQLQPNTTYTLSTSIKETGYNPRSTAFIVGTSNEVPTTTSGGISNVSPITKTTESDGILKLYKRISGTGVMPTKDLFDAGDWLMLNTGSTALPYEPFGVKIPISSANITTPIYFGEVETTRKIKKLVLDGTETITEESTNVYSIPITDTVTTGIGLSTHFEYDSTVSAGQFRIEAGKAVFGYNDTLANFSTFLAAQYAAGTPVTIWYILATETTGIVNDPLMRIGDYADEVSGISIPTTDGANTLSVDTTVQPSEVSVNYHGWHMGTVHERTAGQWD